MKKLTLINIIMILFSILSCTTKSDNKYFNFDDLEYYQKQITSDDLLKEYKKKELSNNYDESLIKILEGDYPKKINDTIENQLISCGYLKKIITKDKYEYVNFFFCEDNCGKYKKSACEPIFRDVLIFKKDGKIIGISKICFRCNTAYIIGTKKEYNYYGECENFAKLEVLLNAN